ncbi:MAG: aspartyl/glutamyl-tRNA amidotransferase subunit C [Methanoregulaceae archaeon PtaB.Bin108]|nr:MAG: aspartyl/glutamyl-tRNA amidotransferase subunit C [Methanoregulaceae archaeon PtaB.Bin108]
MNSTLRDRIQWLLKTVSKVHSLLGEKIPAGRQKGMITEKDTEHIAQLADIAIHKEELAAFTSRFNEILEYFDLLDQVDMVENAENKECNVLREDEIVPSLSQDKVLSNVREQEDGFFKAPRVM